MSQPEPTAEADSPNGMERSLVASFVVRVWMEARTPAGLPVCRGQIVHVQSGAVTHFTDAARMLAFMARYGVTDFFQKGGDPHVVPDHANP